MKGAKGGYMGAGKLDELTKKESFWTLLRNEKGRGNDNSTGKDEKGSGL